jgi:microcystin-dependent protein
MAIDFPNSPTTNQDYTVGTTTWTYDGAKWVLKTYNSLHAVPVTAMMLWASTTYPTGWLLADGAAISRTTYADLFAAIGTIYGVGDGSTTFNLPSMTSAGTGSPKTIIKVTNSGALEPSVISHASNHQYGGSDVVLVDPLQIIQLTIEQKVASYALVFGDRNKFIEMNVGSANILTVPTNATQAFPIGSQVNILQVGAGQTTIAGASGVTVNATPGLKLRTQWSSATLIKRATDVWLAIGDLVA